MERYKKRIAILMSSLGLTLFLTACRNDDFSQLDILGGKLDNDSKRATVGLFVTSKNGELRNCVGVVVGKRKVVTAANCIYKSDEAIATNVTIFSVANQDASGLDQIDSLPSSNSFAAKLGYVPVSAGQANLNSLERRKNDVALLFFDQDLSSFSAALLATATPQAGDKVELIGYGNTDPENDGTYEKLERHSATNIVASVVDGIIRVESTDLTKGGAISTGDTGSPIYNEKDQLVGIATGGGYRNATNDLAAAHLSAYVDITRPDIAEFIKNN